MSGSEFWLFAGHCAANDGSCGMLYR